MVMEADNRVRGPHTTQQGPGLMPPLPQQQNWGVPYQQHVQHRHGPGLQHMVMQPRAPWTGAYPVAMQGMPFQGPVMFHMNGPAPAHMMAMHQVQHHPWMGQPYMQHPQPIQQAQMQAAHRLRHSAPNMPAQHMRPLMQAAGGQRHSAVSQVRPGASGMQPVSAMAMAAGAPGMAAVSKSAAHGVLVQPLVAGTARQAQAAAAGDPLNKQALGAAAAAAGGMEAAEGMAMYDSDEESVYDDIAQSSDNPQNDGSSGWAWLVDGVLQQVVACLHGNSASLSAFRATCVNWKACADTTMQTLSPKALLPKDLIRLFPALQHLQLVSCRNVRNRDLYVLANNDLRLTRLVLGDDTNKPWVTNRGIESIAKMTNLKFLALHDCNSITNNGITAMSEMKNLNTLSLRGCRKLTNNGMKTISALTNVTQLNLYGCKRLSCAGMADLQPLPLKALALGQTRIRTEGMAHIAELTQLTELHLVKEDIKLDGLAHLSKLKELQVLSLRDMKLNNMTVQALLGPLKDQLKELSLFRNTDITDGLGQALESLICLTALDLRETSFEDKGLSKLTTLDNLRVLKLKPNPFGGVGQPGVPMATYLEVSRLTQLNSLAVALPVLQIDMMKSIGKLTGLQELDLGRGSSTGNTAGNMIAEEHVLHVGVYAEVGSLTLLTSLDLSRRRMVERQEVGERKKQHRKGKYPSELRTMMERLHRLKYINLGSTAIEADAIKRLTRHFPAVDIDGRRSMAESTPDLASYGLAGTLCVL